MRKGDAGGGGAEGGGKRGDGELEGSKVDGHLQRNWVLKKKMGAVVQRNALRNSMTLFFTRANFLSRKRRESGEGDMPQVHSLATKVVCLRRGTERNGNIITSEL